MKSKTLLTSQKPFYKGNMHAHSTFSDGSQTPWELKALYKSHGYSFIAITDHEVVYDHSYLDDDGFITITGAEYGIKEDITKSVFKNPDMKVCHLNLYAKEQHNAQSICYCPKLDRYSDAGQKEILIQKYGSDDRAYGAEGISNLIKNLNDANFFVAYNHPGWSLENSTDYLGYEGLWGVEIYNHACNLMGINSYEIKAHDNFHRAGKRVFASCGDDNHDKDKSLGAFVMVNCETLTYKNIISALLNGDFYSSHGPLINELYIENGKVKIKCSDAKRISYSTRGRRSEAVNALRGEYLTEAEFEICDADVYFRISVTDEQGNHADTQSYYIE
ncbi:MAG: hypothetical protein II998_05455 [Clostridia bacterium]|nr:hypothetical protein [Clostridia bacterium]